MSPELSTWIADLRSSETSQRAVAAEQLAQLGKAAQRAAVDLAQVAADGDESVMEWAVAALEQLGPPQVSDCPRLIALLDEAQADITVYWAATLLGRLGGDARSAVAQLTQTSLQHPDNAVRKRAVWALESIG